MSVLYHIGVMMPLVRAMAWVMQKTLGTSGSESLATAANIFVGHTEAPLVVRPFIATMTRSELNAMMVGGFATITGGLMAVFVAEGISAGHLVTASIISAPAALVIAKILQPEIEPSETMGVVSTQLENRASNVIEAAARGASDGMKLAINIAAMLIAFLALIAMMDTILYGLGELVEYLFFSSQNDPSKHVDLNWTLKGLFGILFWPLAWIIGIEAKDCDSSGQMLGTKMVVNEFVAYLDLGKYVGGQMTTVVDGKTVAVSISQRTEVILTYALCGFSNFGAIGIQLGGIGPLAPNRTPELAQLGLRHVGWHDCLLHDRLRRRINVRRIELTASMLMILQLVQRDRFLFLNVLDYFQGCFIRIKGFDHQISDVNKLGVGLLVDDVPLADDHLDIGLRGNLGNCSLDLFQDVVHGPVAEALLVYQVLQRRPFQLQFLHAFFITRRFRLFMFRVHRGHLGIEFLRTIVSHCQGTRIECADAHALVRYFLG